MVILSIDSTNSPSSSVEPTETMSSSMTSSTFASSSSSFVDHQSRNSSRRSSSSTFISYSSIGSSPPMTLDQSIQTSHSHLLEHGRRIAMTSSPVSSWSPSPVPFSAGGPNSSFTRFSPVIDIASFQKPPHPNISSRRSSGCSLRSNSSSSEVTHSSPPTIMEGPIMLSSHHNSHHARGDSSDSFTSPPTFSRLPPDGHEFPPDYRDPALNASGNYHHQQSFDALSRKSSAGSTGSLDRSEFLLEKLDSRSSRPVMRHDENGVSGVRAKIALFSNGGGNSNGGNVAAVLQHATSSSLTRSLTHGDVRYEESSDNDVTDGGSVTSSLNTTKSSDVSSKIAPVASFRSMFNVSSATSSSSSASSRLVNSKKDSVSAADLVGATTTPVRSTVVPTPARGHIQGRSQSLLEIGSTGFEPVVGNKSSAKGAGSTRGRTRSSVQLTPGQTGVVERVPSLLEQRRRSALSKLKGLVIPENNETMTSSPSAVESPKNVLSTPPWKSSNSTLPKYSPAFKRKPFAVYGTSSSSKPAAPEPSSPKPKPSERRYHETSPRTSDVGLTEPKPPKRLSVTSTTTSHNIKSDNDSDNDSAVSSGRSSLSHGSASPPLVPPQPTERKNSVQQLVKKSETIDEDVTAESLRILKKDSVEAINRRNIIESCRTSSGVVVGQVALATTPTTPTSTAFAKTNAPTKKFPVSDEVKSATYQKEEKIFRSCPPPPGRPASRSSSFTIAERKKSFEAATSRLTDRHSSQDSLSLKRRGTADLVFEGFSRRRNSNDSPTSDSSTGSNVASNEKTPLSRADSLASENSYPSTRSGSIVSVIERISFRPNGNDEEKKYSAKPQGSSASLSSNSEAKSNNKMTSRFAEKTSDENSSKIEAEKIPTERPKDLPFAPPRKLSQASPSSVVGSKSFKELAERWEKGSGTPSASTVASPSQSVFSPQAAFSSPRRSVGEPTTMEAFLSKYGMDSVDGGSLSIGEDWKGFESNYGAPSFYIPDEATEWESFDPSMNMMINREDNEMMMKKDPTLTYHQHPLSDRKFSVPLYSGTDERSGKGKNGGNSNGNGNVKMRDKNNAAPSRPSSLIETGGPEMKEMKVFEIGNLGDHGGRHRGGLGGQSSSHSNSTSRGSSQADLLDCSTTSDTPKSPLPGSSSRELLEVFGKQDNRRCVSVNDIRRAFEKAEQSLSESVKGGGGAIGGGGGSGFFGLSPSHHRMSSLDSTTSEESSIPTPHNCYGSVSSLISGQTNLKDHYGSITSLASSTSLISPQELQGLIDEANQSLEESGTPSHEIMVIVLHREFSAGSIGITLAGGADYESKEITVHKVIPGTLADRDGRIQKGDRVLSINGRSTKGVTHREALSILKAPRAEVVLVLSRSRSVTPATDYCYDRSDYPSYNYINSGRPPKILESPLDSKSLLSDLKFVDAPRGPPFTVILKKEGTGLGFSLEGGKDSPLGDRPLTIKKIFAGGAADKSGKLKVGDEILSVNNTDCTRMTRLEAWNFMKKLSDGYASLIVRQKLDNSRSREMLATSMSSGALSDNSSISGNKSDSSLSDNSENDTSATTTTTSTTTGKPTTADLTAEQSLEGTKVEAKR